MEAVNKIKILLENANQIWSLFKKRIPNWQAQPNIWDKVKWGFEVGDSAGWYESQAITLHFGAWAGTYGCSSTYKQIDLDGEIFRRHFLKYLNENKEQIMLSIADSLNKEATLLKNKAESELNTQLSRLQELDKTHQP